jgi:glyoxylase-like metal-dependent hydrolase (beta-lactamase superfamily II)
LFLISLYRVASQLFGPTTGRQQKSMAEAGIKPGDIDAVLLWHAHIDHIGGIIGADDKPLFPNAQYHIAQSDFDFRTDEGKMVRARKSLLPERDRGTARCSCNVLAHLPEFRYL